jgi:16S rRNA (cytosine967-C5)-methyltransferase
MTPAARLQAAIDILDGLATSGLPADRFIREFFRARRYAGSKDRAAIAERVYDVFRHRAAYAWRMGAENNRALMIGSLLAEDIDADGIAALFTGDGYGPAALSDAERAALACTPDCAMPDAVQGAFPDFLSDELERRFGDALLPEMRALAERAPVDLRVNTLKAERHAVLQDLWESGFDAQASTFAPHGIRIGVGRNTASLQQSKLFTSGGFEFQDEAAQIAAVLCAATPGLRVLDLAAGAGGKSLTLAAAMQNRGAIVACDVRAGALDQLRERAARAGVHMIAPKLVDHLRADERFDIVLVDAPCSGTGTWRRQPELRWRLTPARLDELNAIQDVLLGQAATHVKPGGRLVYATCSVLPRENEDRVTAFRAAHPHFSPVHADAAWRDAGQEIAVPGMAEYFQASPHRTGTDGFFAAVLLCSPSPPPGERAG